MRTRVFSWGFWACGRGLRLLEPSKLLLERLVCDSSHLLALMMAFMGHSSQRKFSLSFLFSVPLLLSLVEQSACL